MKVLFLCRRLPHAAVTGGHTIVRQRILRLAARGHEVGLATFCDAQERPLAEELRSVVRDLALIDPPPSRKIWNRVRRVIPGGVPSHFAAWRSAAMMRAAGDLVQRAGYAVAIAEFSGMGQYLDGNPWMPAVRKIISCHYSVSDSVRKVADLMKFRPRGWYSSLSLMRGLDEFETDLYRSVDRVLVLTAHERHLLLRRDPHLRISVIPAGVDTEYFQPAQPEAKEDYILFSGHYASEDNRDAVLWFAERAWPALRARHPGLRFLVVGPGVTPDIAALARRNMAIEVTGGVADLRPYLHRAKVFVCPVRLGSGLRLKLLEAMAAGLPVVTTSLGAEGIPFQQGDTGFIADRTAMMVDYISLLLNDGALREAAGRSARELVADRFSWSHGIDLLESVLRDVVQPR